MSDETTSSETGEKRLNRAITIRMPVDVIEKMETRAKIEGRTFAEHFREKVLLALSLLEGRTDDKVTLEEVYELIQEVQLEQSGMKRLLFVKPNESDEMHEGLDFLNTSIGNVEDEVSDLRDKSKGREESILSKVGKLVGDVEDVRKSLSVIHGNTEGLAGSTRGLKGEVLAIKEEIKGPVRMMKVAFAEWKLLTVVVGISMFLGAIIGVNFQVPTQVSVRYEDVEAVVQKQLKDMGKADEGKGKPTDRNMKGTGR